jgi:putative heme-binding domain-containing protein
MPGAWQLSPREIDDLGAYVTSLSARTPEIVRGDPAAGERLYRSNGCAGCHIIRGAGNGFGPELTAIGARRSAAWLREAIEKPQAAFPDAFEYVEIHADGKALRGIRVNEDSFTIQLRDRANRFHSFRKQAVGEIRRLTGNSPMPGYRLSPKDLDDLTAFLANLQGETDAGRP